MMKKLLFFFCLVITGYFSDAQTLFTYGNKTVSQEEFLRAFEKNPEPGDRRKALEAYLPLYINYKLKVQDALDRKMDTLPNQVAELENYRSQLVDNFINTKANTSALVKEAFENSRKDILLGHFYAGFNPADSASISEAAKLAESASAALNANQDLAAVVDKYSNDEGIKASGGIAGWISAFSIPYVYEQAVYALPTGGNSKIFKGANGFHIFKKIKDRPAAGRVKVAQILLVNTDPGNTAIDETNKKLADSLYKALQNGALFEQLALQFSNDRTSYNNGGELPEFGVGSYDEVFEDEAFSLKKKGEISKPFKTTYGWHILKLIEKIPVAATIHEAELNNGLTEKVIASGRAEAVRNNFLQSILPKLDYKPSPVSKVALWRFTDSAVTNGNVKGLNTNEQTVLFSFGKHPADAGEWLQFVKSSRFFPGNESKPYEQLMEEFILAKQMQYLKTNLQTIDPELAVHFKEFKDANLLFEAMDKTVWSKASMDTAGLRNYYNQHKDKYRWDASADALLVTTTDSSLVPEIRDLVKKDPHSWKHFGDTYTGKVLADSGRFELAQLPGSEAGAGFEPGTLTPVVKNELDESETFAYIVRRHPAAQPRGFEDAKGFVINDYQQVLEDRWIAKLKQKYPVKINQATWNKLLASN